MHFSAALDRRENFLEIKIPMPIDNLVSDFSRVGDPFKLVVAYAEYSRDFRLPHFCHLNTSDKKSPRQAKDEPAWDRVLTEGKNKPGVFRRVLGFLSVIIS